MEEKKIMQTISLDTDYIGLAKTVLDEKGISIEKYLSDALKRVYLDEKIPFNSELTYQEQKRLFNDESFYYKNEHEIDLTSDENWDAWWSDSDEDY